MGCNMNGYEWYLLCFGIGYVIGSISFAVLISRAKGVDIFSIGSGNPGATNVIRALGKPFGYTCFLLDAIKGMVSVLIAAVIADATGIGPSVAGIIALIGAIVGHSFSVFLGFRGGKGVSTTVGGIFALMPMVILIGALIWLIAFFATRYVSLASILLGISLPISAWFIEKDPRSFGFCLLLGILIIVRHRDNIKRLLAGTENRAGKVKS